MHKLLLTAAASLCLWPTICDALITKLESTTSEFLPFCETDQQSCKETISAVGTLLHCRPEVGEQDINAVKAWMASHAEVREWVAVRSIGAGFNAIWHCK